MVDGAEGGHVHHPRTFSGAMLSSSVRVPSVTSRPEDQQCARCFLPSLRQCYLLGLVCELHPVHLPSPPTFPAGLQAAVSNVPCSTRENDWLATSLGFPDS